MKKFLVLMVVFSAAVMAQQPLNTFTPNAFRAIKINHSSTAQPDTEIIARTYTTTLADTSEPLNCGDFATVYVVVQTTDTATILIKAARSVNGNTWEPYSTVDSLQGKNASGVFKSSNLTTTFGGAKAVKLIFAFDTKSFSWANLAAKKYTAYFVGKKF